MSWLKRKAVKVTNTIITIDLFQFYKQVDQLLKMWKLLIFVNCSYIIIFIYS